MARKFKKTVEVEAIRWMGDNFCDIDEFITVYHETYPADGIIRIPVSDWLRDGGCMTAVIGDWIVKREGGKFYPLRDIIFKLTFEEIN